MLVEAAEVLVEQGMLLLLLQVDPELQNLFGHLTQGQSVLDLLVEAGAEVPQDQALLPELVEMVVTMEVEAQAVRLIQWISFLITEETVDRVLL